jgi:large subunit ribosomal protein L17
MMQNASALVQDGQVISTPVLVIIAILLLILFIWLLLRWRASTALPPPAAPTRVTLEPGKVDMPPAAVEMPVTLEPEMVEMPPAAMDLPAVDDLVIIEGIGPKIASVLNLAGITSFAQLASMSVQEITDIVHAGGVRLFDAQSWPEQARLAANGDQAGLQALQDSLKGGRSA